MQNEKRSQIIIGIVAILVLGMLITTKLICGDIFSYAFSTTGSNAFARLSQDSWFCLFAIIPLVLGAIGLKQRVENYSLKLVLALIVIAYGVFVFGAICGVLGYGHGIIY